MKLKNVVLFIVSCQPFFLSAQHHLSNDSTKVIQLKDVFTKAEVEGHIRNYFMSTINQGELKDYYTNATGGAIGIKTLPYKGFSIGIKGIFTYQTYSSDLNEKDEQTNQVSKWEHELYDINDLENYNDLDRLEELYINYTFKRGFISLGKMPLKETTLVNKSDGRMKPFAFSGAQLQLSIDSATQLYAAVIGHVSPRSTVEWYNFDEAIGIVSNGYQPNGTKANYKDFTNSHCISILALNRRLGTSTVLFSNYHIHHILNTSLIQWRIPIGSFEFNLQYLIQFADRFQQSLDYENRYVQPSENGQLASIKTGYTFKKNHFSLAYTHLLATGRFLFPKELGRDQINTSISRSRAEGLGDTHVFTFDYEYNMDKQTRLEIEATTVLQNNPEPLKFNKYSIDNYYQINSRIRHNVSGFLNGLELSLLYVFKENYEQNEAVSIFNKSNYHQINFIANYNF